MASKMEWWASNLRAAEPVLDICYGEAGKRTTTCWVHVAVSLLGKAKIAQVLLALEFGGFEYRFL